MFKSAQKITYKKIALALSLSALILWAILGTGASLAWFTDTSDDVTNIFHFADFELAVSHRTADGTWEPIDSKTDVFDDTALYEPGYVQTVYLKVENKGTRAFDFKTAVSVTGYTTATNVFGQHFFLQDYLKFGVAAADTESEMDQAISTRDEAKRIATTNLKNYSTDTVSLNPGDTAFLAIVVRMPEEVENESNYKGDTVPKVELGIIVKAEQQK